MDVISGFFMVVLGLIIGSFVNCALYRIEQDESILGRSYCPHCKHQLSWMDLFPIVSFLYLGGKCRYCQAKISIQYPLVEVLYAALFLFIACMTGFGQPLYLVFLLYICSALLAIFIYDAKHYLIPDVILLPAVVVAFLYRLSLPSPQPWYYYVGAALLASGFFFIIFFISRETWMGFGDVKLALLLGLLLGFPNILAGLFLSFFIGAVVGIISLLAKKKGLKSQMPFAPFLITGTFIALFWGQQLIAWYLNLFTW